MRLELDATTKALYLRLDRDRVAETVELDDPIVADRNADGATLGIGSVHGEDVAPFLRRHPEVVVLPSRLAYVSLDTGKAWDAETGVGEDGSLAERADANARLHGEFVGRLLADASLLDRIPQGASLLLAQNDALVPQG